MGIHEVMVDPKLQVPGQEPSVSSKYGFEGQRVHETLSVVLETLYSAHNLKGGVVKIGCVAVIVGKHFLFILAKIHLYISLGKVKKYY